MGFKIFDSHARDLYSRGQPQGTCVLLEVLSLDSLVHYFRSIHNNDIFEVRGVQIENIQNRIYPVSRVTGIPGWYWILEIKCRYTMGVGLVY